MSLPSPPAAVSSKWHLARHGDRSTIITMPGVTTAQIDELINDLEAAAAAGPAVPRPRRSGLRQRLSALPTITAAVDAPVS